MYYFPPSSVFFVLFRGIYHITPFITVSEKLGAALIVTGERWGWKHTHLCYEKAKMHVPFHHMMGSKISLGSHYTWFLFSLQNTMGINQVKGGPHKDVITSCQGSLKIICGKKKVWSVRKTTSLNIKIITVMTCEN